MMCVSSRPVTVRVAAVAMFFVGPFTGAQDDPASQARNNVCILNEALERKLAEIERAETAKWTTRLADLDVIDDSAPDAVDRYSRRGDAHFFLRRFKEAVADFEAMVRLDPATDAAHWRLGIARYYAGQFVESAAQFDKYHSFDNVDRENGIWRYLAHHRAAGRESARRQLLKYQKDDRPPFRELYRLFEGTLDEEGVRNSIPDSLPNNARAAQLFYVDLYTGLYHLAENDTAAARPALQAAVLSDWPPAAGFGPHWMWQVARAQLAELEKTR